MNDNKLKTAVWEADRHLSVLESALADWQNFKVVDLAGLEKDPNQLRILDQLLFRFSKLQDAIVQRLVPATLSALFEIYEDWGMIDCLNRLEKLGYLDVNNWFRWREIRNRLSHEYPDNEAERFAAILAAITAAAELAEVYQHWRAMLIKKFNYL